MFDMISKSTLEVYFNQKIKDFDGLFRSLNECANEKVVHMLWELSKLNPTASSFLKQKFEFTQASQTMIPYSRYKQPQTYRTRAPVFPYNRKQTAGHPDREVQIESSSVDDVITEMINYINTILTNPSTDIHTYNDEFKVLNPLLRDVTNQDIRVFCLMFDKNIQQYIIQQTSKYFTDTFSKTPKPWYKYNIWFEVNEATRTKALEEFLKEHSDSVFQKKILFATQDEDKLLIITGLLAKYFSIISCKPKQTQESLNDAIVKGIKLVHNNLDAVFKQLTSIIMIDDGLNNNNISLFHQQSNKYYSLTSAVVDYNSTTTILYTNVECKMMTLGDSRLPKIPMSYIINPKATDEPEHDPFIFKCLFYFLDDKREQFNPENVVCPFNYYEFKKVNDIMAVLKKNFINRYPVSIWRSIPNYQPQQHTFTNNYIDVILLFIFFCDHFDVKLEVDGEKHLHLLTIKRDQTNITITSTVSDESQERQVVLTLEPHIDTFFERNSENLKSIVAFDDKKPVWFIELQPWSTRKGLNALMYNIAIHACRPTTFQEIVNTIPSKVGSTITNTVCDTLTSGLDRTFYYSGCWEQSVSYHHHAICWFRSIIHSLIFNRVLLYLFLNIEEPSDDTPTSQLKKLLKAIATRLVHKDHTPDDKGVYTTLFKIGKINDQFELTYEHVMCLIANLLSQYNPNVFSASFVDQGGLHQAYIKGMFDDTIQSSGVFRNLIPRYTYVELPYYGTPVDLDSEKQEETDIIVVSYLREDIGDSKDYLELYQCDGQYSLSTAILSTSKHDFNVYACQDRFYSTEAYVKPGAALVNGDIELLETYLFRQGRLKFQIHTNTQKAMVCYLFSRYLVNMTCVYVKKQLVFSKLELETLQKDVSNSLNTLACIACFAKSFQVLLTKHTKTDSACCWHKRLISIFRSNKVSPTSQGPVKEYTFEWKQEIYQLNNVFILKCDDKEIIRLSKPSIFENVFVHGTQSGELVSFVNLINQNLQKIIKGYSEYDVAIKTIEFFFEKQGRVLGEMVANMSQQGRGASTHVRFQKRVYKVYTNKLGSRFIRVKGMRIYLRTIRGRYRGVFKPSVVDKEPQRIQSTR